MSQQIINVGQAANDGTGEPLRSAFTAVNNNFDQVWAAGPVGSQVVIVNNSITTTETNLDLVLHANGIGNITVYNSITPWTDSVYDIGSTSNQFDTVWARYYRGNAALMTGLPVMPDLTALATDLISNANLAYDIGAGTQRWATVFAGTGDFSRDVTIRGNLVVLGNVVEMGNSVTDSLTLHLANSVTNAAGANGAGITVGANANIATLLYNTSANIWQTNVGIGTGNIVIQGDNIFDLAGAAITNGDLTHGSTSGLDIVANGDANATVIYNTYGNVEIFASSTGSNVHSYQFGSDGNVGFPGNLSVADSVQAAALVSNSVVSGNVSVGSLGYQQLAIAAAGGQLVGGPDLLWQFANARLWTTGLDSNGAITTSGMISAAGNITANYFVGNGSQLTGLPAGYANSDAVAYGESGWAGNVIPAGNAAYSLGNSTNQWSDLYVSNATIYMNNVPISLTSSNTLTVNGEDVVVTNADGNTALGNLEVVGSGIFVSSNSSDTQINISPDPEGWAFLQLPNNNTANSDNTRLVNAGGNVTVETGDFSVGSNSYTWLFGNDGNLTTPTNLVIGTSGAGGTSISQFDAPLQVVSEAANGAVVMGWAVDQNSPDSIAVIGMNTPYVNGAANALIAVGNNATTVNYWNFANDGTTTFPTLTVNLHNGGNQAGQVLQFGDPAQQAIITGPTPAVDNNAQRLIIQGQRGNGSGEGGDVYLWGGDANYNGGDIKIYAGDADDGTTGQGGYINIEGGSGWDSGGYVSITAGQSSNGQGATASVNGGYGATRGGDANINGGYGSVDGGHINIQGGYAAGSGTGGNVNIVGGGSGNGLASYGNINLTAGASTWAFDNAGNLTLPGGGIVYGSPYTPSGAPGNTITLQPAGSGTITDQRLLVYPTAGDGDHIHLATGNLYQTELFLGSDNLYVKLSASGNIVVNANDGTGNTAQWNFGTDGAAIFPGNITASGYASPAPTINGFSSIETIDSANLAGTGFSTSGVTLIGGTGVIESSANNVSIYSDSSQFNGLTMYGDGTGNDGIEIYGNTTVSIFTDYSNIAYQTTFQQSGNIITAGSILPGTANTFDIGNGVNYFRDAYFSNNVVAESFATVDGGLTHSGTAVGINANAGKDVYLYADGANVGWTFDAAGNLTLPGNTFAVNYANGVQVSLGGGSYGNANVVANLAALGSNPVSTTGNITGGNLVSSATIFGNPDIILGNVANVSATKTRLVTDTTFSYIQTGNGTVGSTGNIVFSPYSSATQRVVIDTSSGNLTAAGNVTAQNFIGNISITGNVTGTSPNVSLVAGSYTYTFDNTGILTLPAPAIGNEGGEIAFTQAANSTLAGNTVVMDQYVDRFRFFESGGNTRGAYIDFTQAADGVGTLLNNRVSGLVNAGTFVTMDLLKATVTTSGNRGLSLAATTGSFNINISGTYGGVGGASGSAGTGTIDTTPSTSQFGWNFTSQAEGSTYIITDTTNNRAYRVTLQIGGSFNNNMISIERLV